MVNPSPDNDTCVSYGFILVPIEPDNIEPDSDNDADDNVNDELIVASIDADLPAIASPIAILSVVNVEADVAIDADVNVFNTNIELVASVDADTIAPPARNDADDSTPPRLSLSMEADVTNSADADVCIALDSLNDEVNWTILEANEILDAVVSVCSVFTSNLDWVDSVCNPPKDFTDCEDSAITSECDAFAPTDDDLNAPPARNDADDSTPLKLSLSIEADVINFPANDDDASNDWVNRTILEFNENLGEVEELCFKEFKEKVYEDYYEDDSKILRKDVEMNDVGNFLIVYVSDEWIIIKDVEDEFIDYEDNEEYLWKREY